MGAGGSGDGGSAGAAGQGGSGPASQSCSDLGLIADGCTCAELEGRAYLFCITPAKTWEAAELECSFYDMQLTRVNGPQENTWILSEAAKITVPSYFQYFWIGGSSIGEAGNWRWPDGVQFWQGLNDGSPIAGVYVNWRSGVPNDGLDEFCAQMDVDGWDDTSCDDTRAYVCESY